MVYIIDYGKKETSLFLYINNDIIYSILKLWDEGGSVYIYIYIFFVITQTVEDKL